MGLIVSGYPGIGKTTVAMRSVRFIDLESSGFSVDGQKTPMWFIPYCKIAVNLAAQGYHVFVSAHEVVQSYLDSIALPEGVSYVRCAPSKLLKAEWLNKLMNRYLETNLQKDKAAAVAAVENYDEQVEYMLSKPNAIELTSMDYDLETVIWRAEEQILQNQ